MHRKIISTLICVLSIALCSGAADKTAKPKLKVEADGFPSGHATPEGAACDLARAFIRCDVGLFTNTCIRFYSGGESLTNYQAFLDTTIQSVKDEAARKKPSPFAPKAIGEVFAARHLTMYGPASYGYASFGFEDVRFVDVGLYLHNGEREFTRMLVIKDRDGKWYVHPAPDVSPLLSTGFKEESKSTRDLMDAYTIEK